MEQRVEQLRLWSFLVLSVGALIFIYTLAPLELEFRGISGRIAEAKSWTTAEGWPRSLGHFVAFGSFGLCLGKYFGERRTALASYSLAFFSICLELAQLLVPERHARLTDWLLNSSAGLAGIYLSRKIGINATGATKRRFLQISCVVSIVLWLLASIAPLPILSLKSWDPDPRIVVGNELDGTEPWNGTIDRIEVRALSGNGEPRTGQSWLVYEFSKGQSTAARGLLSDGLNLRLHDEDVANTALVSEDTVARVCREISQNGSFQVIAHLGETYRSTNFAGRLVSFSSSPTARNFMLGREGDDLVFRVRNGLMEENGRRNILVARNALQNAVPSLLATYDHGIAFLKSGNQLLKRIDLRQPSVSLGFGAGSGGAISAGVLLGLFLAVPLSFLNPVRDTLPATTMAIAGTAAVASIPFLVVCLILGGPANLSFPGIAVVAIGLTYLVAHFYCAPNVNPLLRSGSSGSEFPL